jgi:hypothetical protein
MLISRIAELIQTIVSEDGDAVSRLVKEGRQFEKWLQIEAYKLSIRQSPDVEMKLEQPYPDGSGQRCDFCRHEADGQQSWVEMATCATNYGQPGKPITQQISKTIAELQKLMRAPAGANRHIFLLAYPMPANGIPPRQWDDHLSRIQARAATIELVFTMPLGVAPWQASMFAYVITPSLVAHLQSA